MEPFCGMFGRFLVFKERFELSLKNFANTNVLEVLLQSLLPGKK